MGILNFFKKNKNTTNNNGLNEVYSENGKGKIIRRFYKKNGLEEGIYEIWCPNTEKITDRYIYKDGLKEGPHEKFFKNTNILLGRSNYIKDKLDGISEQFYQNGKTRSSKKYGKKGVTEEKTFNESGVLIHHYTPKKKSKFYDNGDVKFEEKTKKSQQYFYKNGQVRIERLISKEHPKGKFYHYDENGNKISNEEIISFYSNFDNYVIYQDLFYDYDFRFETPGVKVNYRSRSMFDTPEKIIINDNIYQITHLHKGSINFELIEEVMTKTNWQKNEHMSKFYEEYFGHNGGKKEQKTKNKKTNTDNIDVIITSLYGYLSGFGDNKVTVNMSRENIREVLEQWVHVNEDEVSTDKKLDQYLEENDYMMDPQGGWYEVFDDFTNVETVCVNRTKYLQNYEGDSTYLEMRDLETINYGMSCEEKTKNPELQTKLKKDLNHNYFLKVKQTKNGDFEVFQIEDEEEIKKLQKLFDDMIERGGILDTGRDFYHIDKFNLKEELKSY